MSTQQDVPPASHRLSDHRFQQEMTLEEGVRVLLQETDLGTPSHAMELMGRLASETEFFRLPPGESAQNLGQRLLAFASDGENQTHPTVRINYNQLKWAITRRCPSAMALLERLRHGVLHYDEAARLVAERYGMARKDAMVLIVTQNPPILDEHCHRMEWDTSTILQRLRSGDETAACSYWVTTSRLRELLLFAGLPEPFPQWWPESRHHPRTEGVVSVPTEAYPHEWDFLPRSNPHRRRVIAICRGAEMTIDGDQEGRCRYGGKLSAARIARLVHTISRHWWQDPHEPIPTERTLTEWITLWLKAGAPKTDTMGQ